MKDDRRALRLRVGRNVSRLRHLHRLSQERLAERAGITSKYMSLVERGRANVTIDVLAAIASALSVEIGDLVGPSSRSVYRITRAQLTRIEHALRAVDRVKQSSRRRTRTKVR